MKTQKIPSGFLSIFLKKDYTVSNSERVSRVKGSICNGALISMAVMAIPTLIGSLSRAFETGLKPAMFIQVFIAMSICVAYFIRKRLPYWFRASLLIFALYFVSLTGLLQFGLLASAGAWLIIIPALSVILFNIRTGLAMMLITFISFVVITTLNVKGFIVFEYNVSEYAASLSSWVNFSMTYLLGSVFVFIAISISTNSLMNTVSETDDIAKDLARLIETANNPILEVDTEGKVNEWNETFEKITGFKKSEVLGQDFVEIYITEDYKKLVKQVLSDALKGEETTNFEFPFFTKEGSRVIILLNSSTRKNTNGEIVGVLGVGQDITILNQHKKDLESKVESEKELSLLKTSFVSMASHEFRTPLTSISSTSDVLLKYYDRLSQDDINQRLEKIKLEVKDMTIMLEDILIIGKSDAQKLKFNPERLDIVSLTKDIITDYQLSEFKDRDLIYSASLPEILIQVDRKWIKHIVINLLSNALKYSEDDTQVIVSIKKEQGSVYLHFKDSGIGISKEDIKLLFEPFHRGENVGEILGTGLGLSVLKKAVELHKGKIKVKSEVGKGSNFEVILPAI
ncbi:MAG: PAS domain S-box-containing protein [Flavobacteriaceae bacterium]|jgi:PAS domain S-box-containing protein